MTGARVENGISDILQMKMFLHQHLTQIAAKKNSRKHLMEHYEAVCQLLLNPNDKSLAKNDSNLIGIRSYLLNSKYSKIMKNIILETLVPSKYLPHTNFLSEPNLPSLLASLYVHSKRKDNVVTVEYYLDSKRFSKEKLTLLFAAMKVVGLKTSILDLDCERGGGRNILFLESARKEFLEVIQSGNFIFDTLKFGCRSSIVLSNIDETTWRELLTTLKIKELYIGYCLTGANYHSLSQEKFNALINGILASEITSLKMPACKLNLLSAADWTLLFDTLTQKNIHSFEMNLNNDTPLFETAELMKAFLEGLSKARITQFSMQGWGCHNCLSPKKQSMIDSVISDNIRFMQNNSPRSEKTSLLLNSLWRQVNAGDTKLVKVEDNKRQRFNFQM
jgi:hypothetical protein